MILPQPNLLVKPNSQPPAASLHKPPAARCPGLDKADASTLNLTNPSGGGVQAKCWICRGIELLYYIKHTSVPQIIMNTGQDDSQPGPPKAFLKNELRQVQRCQHTNEKTHGPGNRI